MIFRDTVGTYLDERYAYILQWEESGNPNLTPYNDGSGWVTIGIGFNLADANVRNKVFAAMGIVDANLISELSAYLSVQHVGVSNVDIQNHLNGIMSKYPACSGTFEFLSATQVKDLFKELKGSASHYS